MRNPGVKQLGSVSQGFRVMFYMLQPNETSFQSLEEVPDYVKQVSPLLKEAALAPVSMRFCSPSFLK